MNLQRYKLTLEYNGAPFCGWQRQNEVPSVQQALEEAITAFSGQRVEVYAAGRTDAGVHARGQVVHVDFEAFTKPMSGFEILKAINAHLRPAPVSVIAAEPCAADFPARHMAVNKLYRYRIVTRPAALALDKGYAWLSYQPLDVPAMQKAAGYMLGQHDFSAFRAAECQAHTAVRTLDRLDVSVRAYDHEGAQEIWIEAEARSFCIIRCVILRAVSLGGVGQMEPRRYARRSCGAGSHKGRPTAPADGLYLLRVDYS